jgi:hypothetical protein
MFPKVKKVKPNIIEINLTVLVGEGCARDHIAPRAVLRTTRTEIQSPAVRGDFIRETSPPTCAKAQQEAVV